MKHINTYKLFESEYPKSRMQKYAEELEAELYKSEKEEAKKLGLIPIDECTIGQKCIWFSTFKSGNKTKQYTPVIIQSNIIGTDENPRVRVDHILDDNKTKSGGYVNIKELYMENPYLKIK
jgi:hypothetical protein